MAMNSDACSPTVRLNIGGKKFCTTVDTLTHREPQSMLAAMFSGRHTVYKDFEKGYVFIDREGKHFRHILRWLRDGVVPILNLSDLERVELLWEAEYYQLLGLVDKINEVLNKKDEQMDADLTRTDIIKLCLHESKDVRYFRLRGVNLSGLDLSRLNLSGVNFSFACLKNVNFSDAILERCIFRGANLLSAQLQRADLTGVDFQEANLEGADLKGANRHSAHLEGANLQSADLRRVMGIWREERDMMSLRGAIIN